MRKRMQNHFFTIFYVGLHPKSTASESERKEYPSLAIARDGEFVSLCTKDGCAVFYSAQELRELRDTLDEAADLLEEYQAQATP